MHLEKAIEQHEAVVVDPALEAGKAFLIARPHHVRKAWEEAARLYQAAGKAEDARRRRIEELEARIGEREAEVKEIEAKMAAPGFYDDHEASKPVIDRHQALMWEVGDLMAQWEAISEEN